MAEKKPYQAKLTLNRFAQKYARKNSEFTAHVGSDCQHYGELEMTAGGGVDIVKQDNNRYCIRRWNIVTVVTAESHPHETTSYKIV